MTNSGVSLADITTIDGRVILFMLLAAIGLLFYAINHLTEWGHRKYRVDDIEYKNWTPLTTELFKEIPSQLLPVFIALGPTALVSTRSTGSFFISPLGRLLCMWLGYLLYYQIWQPHVTNRMPFRF
jgi:hypothetical protein